MPVEQMQLYRNFPDVVADFHRELFPLSRKLEDDLHNELIFLEKLLGLLADDDDEDDFHNELFFLDGKLLRFLAADDKEDDLHIELFFLDGKLLRLLAGAAGEADLLVFAAVDFHTEAFLLAKLVKPMFAAVDFHTEAFLLAKLVVPMFAAVDFHTDIFLLGKLVGVFSVAAPAADFHTDIFPLGVKRLGLFAAAPPPPPDFQNELLAPGENHRVMSPAVAVVAVSAAFGAPSAAAVVGVVVSVAGGVLRLWPSWQGRFEAGGICSIIIDQIQQL